MRVIIPLTRSANKVTVFDGDDVEGPYQGEYCAYRIELETDSGTWIIQGCHDSGPDVIDPKGKRL